MSIQAEQPISLGAGVTLQPHPNLDAQVRMASYAQSNKAIGGRTLSQLRQNTRPLQFTASRGVDAGLDTVEIVVNNFASLKSVTPESPLIVTTEQQLGHNECVLPIAYDGKFVIPLGLGRDRGNSTEIKIDRLPTPESTRSLGGAIQILFQKVVAEKFDRDFKYPCLAVVDKAQPEQIETDLTVVKQQVEAAETIVLFIHGIIGDTRSMVPCIHEAQLAVASKEKSLADIYDLVLSFDYESLNTPIEFIAEQLRDRLAAVGLLAQHGKTLHVVAHSMGGLISRYFIEQRGGHKVVQHLIMLGTPNGGSPWSTVQAMALASLTFVLNDLLISPPAKLLGSLAAAIENADITLDQMQPNSDFLKSLNAKSRQRVPYTLVAGNTSIVDPNIPAAQNRVQSLLKKLNQFGRKAIELPFFEEPNDIAVAVHNMQKVPSDRKYPLQVVEVACNHLVYFTSPVGLRAIANAIESTGITQKI